MSANEAIHAMQKHEYVLQNWIQIFEEFPILGCEALQYFAFVRIQTLKVTNI